MQDRKQVSMLFAAMIVVTTFSGLSTLGTTTASDESPALSGFVPASNGLPGPPVSQHSVWFGDINNDTFLDIATAGYSGVQVWTGDGAGTWTPASTNLPGSAYDGGVCLGDIDNDGNLDIAAANYNFGAGGVAVWRGDGAGSWTPAATGLPITRWRTGIFLGDVNHDDNLDLAVASEAGPGNPGGVQVFAGNGAGVWTNMSTNLPIAGKYYAVWMGDVNNDNNTDLAVAGAGLHVYLGNGAGIWAEASNGLPSMTDQWNSVTLGDIDLDGNLDIVSGMDMGGHGIKAWLGDGTSNWTAASTGLPTSGLYYAVVLADLVGDKFPDILAAGYSGEGVRIWRGDGGNTWTDASTGLPTGSVIGIDAGDIDNNGYVDIAAVGENFGVRVLKNDETVPPISVTLEVPNGGEDWLMGSQHSINWTTSGGTPPHTLNIEYSTTGVRGPYTIVSSGETNDGNYLWTVPSTPSTDSFVRISVTDSGAKVNWDKSDTAFTISAIETTPPVISNLNPVNQSFMGTASPTIGASYSDASGIDTASVILMVDLINVTSMATVTTSDVTYSPTALFEGPHDVYLEVRDSSANRNRAVKTWQFTVDLTPPLVTSLQPTNQSTIGDSTPFISAAFSDPAGINTTSVSLKIDLMDITGATVTPSSVSYNIPSPMADGVHDVHLMVNDSASPANRAVVTWWFTIDTTIPDTTPPSIANLQPVNHSTLSNPRPLIGASYSDSSGISLPSVILRVDSVNVTTFATVTPAGVSYTPMISLFQGTHSAYLEVKDDSAAHNVAVATWDFTIDSLPPLVTNINPSNSSTVSDTTPQISASYSDATGVDLTSVILIVDSTDVTSIATIAPGGVSYTPQTTMSEGVHNVHLEVADTLTPPNTAFVTWWFIIDTSPPIITDTQPLDQSIISDNTPFVGAIYDDSSGISVASVILKVDSLNVTQFAIVTQNDIGYVPPTPLAEGLHDIYLEVKDASGNHNMATASWQFVVDMTRPTIIDPRPADNSITNETRPEIRADYDDDSGIEIDSIVLNIDSINVTSSSTITDTGISFLIAASLSEGDHTVYLEVGDISTPRNVATLTWTFTIDSRPPVIAHEPVLTATVGNEIKIIATVTDNIEVDSVSLHYRKTGDSVYSVIPMVSTVSSSVFTATIPSTDVTVQGIEYFIEANDTAGNLAGRPPDNWKASPYEIIVQDAPPSEFPTTMVFLGVTIAIAFVVAVVILLLLRRKKARPETRGSGQPDHQSESED